MEAALCADGDRLLGSAFALHQRLASAIVAGCEAPPGRCQRACAWRRSGSAGRRDGRWLVSGPQQSKSFNGSDAVTETQPRNSREERLVTAERLAAKFEKEK
jgi:hypothetical protein